MKHIVHSNYHCYIESYVSEGGGKNARWQSIIIIIDISVQCTMVIINYKWHVMTINSTLESNEYNTNPWHKPGQLSTGYFKWNLENLEILFRIKPWNYRKIRVEVYVRICLMVINFFFSVFQCLHLTLGFVLGIL